MHTLTARTIAISGASGWMGRSAAHAALDLFGQSLELALLSRSAGQILVNGRNHRTTTVDRIAAGRKPDIFVPTNFVTREFFFEFGETLFLAQNKKIVSSAVNNIRRIEPKSVVVISSGVTSKPHDPSKDQSYRAYRDMKLFELEQLTAVSDELGVPLIEARLYSASGKYMKSPELFAFGNIVKQARSGSVELTSSHEVWRKYLDAVDFMKVCLASALAEKSRVVESGGFLVEVETFASTCLSLFGFANDAIKRPRVSGTGDRYYSSSEEFELLAEEMGITIASLEDQILTVSKLFER